MQTPAILNISSPATSQASGNRTAAAAPDGTFNQMLSQQVAGRRDADKAAQARAAEKSGKNETRQAETRQQAPASKPQDARQESADSDIKEAASAPGDREQAAIATDAMPLTATELLAQLAGAALQPQAAAPASSPSAPTGIDTVSLPGQQDLLAAAEPGVQRDQPAAASAQAGFGATLRDAAQRQAPPQQAGTQASAIPAAASDAAGKDTLDKLVELPAVASAPEAATIQASAQLQLSGLDAAHAAGGKGAERLTPHVGTPAWDQALGQKVVWMVAGAQQSASLTLNPPDLGPLQVVLNVSNGQADASFYAAQPEVRQALESALPKLRDMLDQAGIELGQASVSAGMPDRHNAPSSQATPQAGRNAAAGSGAEEQPAQASRATGTIGGRGLVDTFV